MSSTEIVSIPSPPTTRAKHFINAYKKGYLAGLDGLPIASNPYEANRLHTTVRYYSRYWLMGYNDATTGSSQEGKCL